MTEHYADVIHLTKINSKEECKTVQKVIDNIIDFYELTPKRKEVLNKLGNLVLDYEDETLKFEEV